MPNNASAVQRSGGAQSHNALGLLALAAGAFVLGAAEFVMMGILPQAAQALPVGRTQQRGGGAGHAVILAWPAFALSRRRA